jgi:cyclopropane-fatty-acyl-phospholipid synthase
MRPASPATGPFPPARSLAPLGPAARVARKALAWSLRNIAEGELVLVDAEGAHHFGKARSGFPCRAEITVYDGAFYTRAATGGSVGAAESYMDGQWTCDDLAALFRVLSRNEAAVLGIESKTSWVTRPLRALLHALHRNSTRGSRRNIAAHYDLGNEFYSLFLDPTLTYSCAVFESPDASMEEAQRSKYERICQKLALSPEDHLLEIGSGWGGMAIHAATRHGCRVTTTTVSREQYHLTNKRVGEAGLSDRITVLLEDYRKLRGHFDKLVSIEMIEAVGHRYLETYFRVCSDRLKPGGLMCLQAILTSDQRYRFSLRNSDFIKAYIFPGGQLPSIDAITNATRRATDFRLIHVEEIGAHYAETLRRWRELFYKNLESVRELGFPESFVRMWEFYLASCEGAFEERYVGNAQMLFAKPAARRAPVLGALT